MCREEVANSATLYIYFRLLVFLGDMLLAYGVVAVVGVVNRVVAVLPVLTVTFPINRFSIVLGEDTVPDRREIVVDLDSEGKEVLFYVIKVEAIKGMSGNLFLRVTFCFRS